MKSFLHVLMSILFVLLFVSLWGFYFAIYPIKYQSSVTPEDFGVKYENISFTTQDNILIRGWFIPNLNPDAKTIILLHGYPFDKGNILPATIFLHKNFNLLYFDFRALGESTGGYSSFGKEEVNDLLAAIKYLHTRGINKVNIWGFSMGGAVALMTAPKAPEIQSIVAEASYARLDWMAHEYYRVPLLKYPLIKLTLLWAKLFLGYDIQEISPADAAKNINIPVLLIHSKNDEIISYDHFILLQESLRHNPKMQTFILDHEKHGDYFNNASHVKALLEFYNN